MLCAASGEQPGSVDKIWLNMRRCWRDLLFNKNITYVDYKILARMRCGFLRCQRGISTDDIVN